MGRLAIRGHVINTCCPQRFLSDYLLSIVCLPSDKPFL